MNRLNNSFLDGFMFRYSSKWVWIPFYCSLIFFIWREYGLRGLVLCIAMVIVVITFTDQLCASLVRPYMSRLRPSHSMTGLHIVNGYIGGKYGFPSCHAANTMALASCMLPLIKSRILSICFIVWSLVMCYSRLYLGVHYFSDILCGIGFGLIIGHFSCRIVLRIVQLKSIKAPKHNSVINYIVPVAMLIFTFAYCAV